MSKPSSRILDHITGISECRSVRQIAKSMGISVPGAKIHLNRGVKLKIFGRRKVRGTGAPRPVWGYYLIHGAGDTVKARRAGRARRETLQFDKPVEIV